MLSPQRRSPSSRGCDLSPSNKKALQKNQNPVFTITENDLNTLNGSGGGNRRYPKVRQKSKSSGASPQKNPNPQQFHEEFINIITSTDSIDYPDQELGDECNYYYGDLGEPYLGIGVTGVNNSNSSRSNSNASGRSFHSNPYLHTGYYGSKSQLLQVPSSSALLLPGGGGYYEDDDLSPTRNSRQQRSSSITVPIQHHQRSPERCSSEVFVRRCSSASPKGRYNHYQQQQKLLQKQREAKRKSPGLESSPKNQNQGKQRERGMSLTTNAGILGQRLGAELNTQSGKTKRRRSSGYRRPSNQSMMTAFSSSNSSLSDPSSHSPSKRRLSPYNRQRTLSMPNNSVQNTADLSRRNSKKSATTEGSDSKDDTEKVKSAKGKGKASMYDVVIIGSNNVGKSTLAEYFDKAGTSGSDQGIGSEEDESDDYEDEDLSPGKAIMYKPATDLNQQIQYNFSLRIICQQMSAVTYLYKYDGVLILYSVTDRESFEFARKALAEIVPIDNQNNKDGKAKKVVILVGNKSDLERSRCVTPLEGRSLATAYDCKFIEISSSLDVGVDSLQKGLVTQVYLRHEATKDHSGSLKGAKAQLTSSSSSSSTNSSSFLIGQKLRKKKSFGAGNSLKLAQKLLSKIMSIRVTNGKSKSCLDLHTL